MSRPVGHDPLPVKVPDRVPRLRRGLVARLCRRLLILGGWKMDGAFGDYDKLLLIAAPHSSAWDGVWGLIAKMAVGVDVKVLGKAELFRGPVGWLLGPLLAWLGVIPTDRHAANGLVGQIVARYAAEPKFWLVLAPEGTRRKVERWRSGFWHIAREAGVPIQLAYFHYPERLIGLGEVIMPSDDFEADMQRIRAYYKPFQGRWRGT